jgi:hypothetical protein
MSTHLSPAVLRVLLLFSNSCFCADFYDLRQCRLCYGQLIDNNEQFSSTRFSPAVTAGGIVRALAGDLTRDTVLHVYA